MIFDGHEETLTKVDNMDKKIELYEREISDQNEQIKEKEQIIESFQSITNVKYDDLDIENASDLLYKDTGDRVKKIQEMEM